MVACQEWNKYRYFGKKLAYKLELLPKRTNGQRRNKIAVIAFVLTVMMWTTISGEKDFITTSLHVCWATVWRAPFGHNLNYPLWLAFHCACCLMHLIHSLFDWESILQLFLYHVNCTGLVSLKFVRYNILRFSWGSRIFSFLFFPFFGVGGEYLKIVDPSELKAISRINLAGIMAALDYVPVSIN